MHQYFTITAMPTNMPANPWTLVRSYKSIMVNGFPHNFNYEEIVSGDDSWQVLRKIVSKSSYEKYFSAAKGKSKDVYRFILADIVNLHNCNM